VAGGRATDARGRRQPGLARHLRLVPPRAIGGQLRLRVAGSDHGPPSRRRDLSRSGDRHRLATALAVARAPGDAARARGRCAAVARRTPALLPEQPRISRRDTTPCRCAGHPLRGASGVGDVACRQRVRLPRAGVLLRCLRPGVPGLADEAVRNAGGVEPRLGHRLLVAAVLLVGRDRTATANTYVAESQPATRLHALLLGRAARVLRHRASDLDGSEPRRPGHYQLHAVLQTARLLEMG
jgi:hypothetical protein